MQEKIKKIWTSLDSESKERAIKEIKEAFPDANSESSIKQNWFYKNSIPSDKEARVYLILKSNMVKQLNKLTNLIN